MAWTMQHHFNLETLEDVRVKSDEDDMVSISILTTGRQVNNPSADRRVCGPPCHDELRSVQRPFPLSGLAFDGNDSVAIGKPLLGTCCCEHPSTTSRLPSPDSICRFQCASPARHGFHWTWNIVAPAAVHAGSDDQPLSNGKRHWNVCLAAHFDVINPELGRAREPPGVSTGSTLENH